MGRTQNILQDLDNEENSMSGVRVTITIDSCNECRHKGYCIADGRSRAICVHDDSSDSFTEGLSVENKHHWKHRTISLANEPPERCPLRHGNMY